MQDSSQLDSISAELLTRLDKEHLRAASEPATALVGGVVTACRHLESLLRESVRVLAASEGCDPTDIITPPHQRYGRRPLLDKVSAGRLAGGLIHFRRTKPIPRPISALVSDLSATDSAILNFIRVRNEVAKQGADPGLLPEPTRRLKAWVTNFRRSSGWQ